VTDYRFDVPADGDSASGTDAPSGSDFDDQRTATYAPPPEAHASWAPAGWGQQTPSHWLEPIGRSEPEQRKQRGAGAYAALFVVALVAAIIGSGLTYAGLLAAGQLGQVGQRVANVPTPPAPTPGLPSGSGLAGSAAPAPAPVANSVVADAAQRVSPAVVTITVDESGTGTQSPDPNAVPDTGIGSGIIYDAGGFVLTNRHVVGDAKTVSVQLDDGRTVDGSVYGVDTLTDLAIVKIDASNVPAAPIGDSATLQPGQTAIVVGSPLGTFTNTVTAGIVSALGRSLVVTDPVTNEQRRLHNLVQTDAAINPGNSGGPLINADGEVVGVSTAFAQGAQGIFFAIPINIAKPIMEQAVNGEQLTRPWLGIVYTPVDRSVADENKLAIDYGAWIQPSSDGSAPIIADSPAQAAGLQSGDIITSIGGHRIDAASSLDDVLSLFKSGDTLTLEVLRNGQTIELPLTLGTRPAGLN
jgi:2-alkenal reductase